MYDQDELVDRYSVNFGMRDFSRKGKFFTLNGDKFYYEAPISRFNVSLRTRIVKRWLGTGMGEEADGRPAKVNRLERYANMCRNCT